ncbi:MAG: hypothetical protein IPM95_00230 [Sphingobacteriales bacterium]|nr:hypothetical protein [Sphingobacteriales bacterium]
MNFVIAAAFSSCSHNKGEKNQKYVSLNTDSTTSKQIAANSIRYYLDSLTDTNAFRSFNERYTHEQKEIIAALNRLTPSRIRMGKPIIMPDTVYSHIMPYSPFPHQLDQCDSIPKLIIICKRIQAFGAYEFGDLVRWGQPAPGGKKPSPRAGCFIPTSRQNLRSVP